MTTKRPGNPDIWKYAAAGAKARARAARQRRALGPPSLREMRRQVGKLDSPQAAQRWIEWAFELAVTGRIAGATANAAASLVREWGRIREGEVTFEVVEQLRRDVSSLRAERDQLAQEVERLQLVLQRRTA